MKHCCNCGKELNDTDGFCSFCGSKQEQDSKGEQGQEQKQEKANVEEKAVNVESKKAVQFINNIKNGGTKMLKYKVVDGPKEIIVSKGNSQNAFTAFEEIINREAEQGWIFHSVQDLTVTEKLGCIEALFSKTGFETKIYYMLVFCKDE